MKGCAEATHTKSQKGDNCTGTVHAPDERYEDMRDHSFSCLCSSSAGFPSTSGSTRRSGTSARRERGSVTDQQPDHHARTQRGSAIMNPNTHRL